MTGHTITQDSADTVTGTVATAAESVATAVGTSVTLGRAARELGVKRGEFELAVLLGHVRTISDSAGGRRRVTHEEIERVRAGKGFPEAWLERVRAVGTTEGAALMGISTARFTRLSRAGFIVPVKVYLNRYRAVVWLYLAEELKRFAEAEAHAGLLTGRAPAPIRAQLDAGIDRRARNWRGRQAGALLRQSDDPWERAAIVAALLDPVQIAEIIKDPYERAYVRRLMPEAFGQGTSETPAGRIVQKIMTADDPDEIRWLRAHLTIGLSQARGQRPAPRPAPKSESHPMQTVPTAPETAPASRRDLEAEPSPHSASLHEASAAVLSDDDGNGDGDGDGAGRATEPRGLLKWMRRRGA
ncbi:MULTISPECIES: DUF6397 family protein [Streptomyces]